MNKWKKKLKTREVTSSVITSPDSSFHMQDWKMFVWELSLNEHMELTAGGSEPFSRLIIQSVVQVFLILKDACVNKRHL